MWHALLFDRAKSCTTGYSAFESARRRGNLKTVSDLKVKIFADGADKAGMLEMYAKPFIKGFTTNPTLMRKAGIQNYSEFAQDILRTISNRPISFEVFSDEFSEMEAQAKVIAACGKNVYVKIPITNTRGDASYDLVHRLSHSNVQVNVTAIMTLEQVREVAAALSGGAPSCVSVFCRSNRGHGQGSSSDNGGIDRTSENIAESGIDLGESARVAQYLSGRRYRMPHHYGYQRYS